MTGKVVIPILLAAFVIGSPAIAAEVCETMDGITFCYDAITTASGSAAAVASGGTASATCDETTTSCIAAASSSASASAAATSR